MAEGGSFLSSGVGEPSRRAFLDVDKRVKAAQDDAASALAQIAALSPDHGSLLGLGDDDHPQYLTEARGDARYYTQSQVDSSLSGYLPLSGGTVTGQTTFSAPDGVKITGSSGGVWFDDRNGDGSKYVLYHQGNFFGIWNGVNTPHRFYDSGRVDITDGGDSNYIYFGPNATWGGQLYVGATTDKATTNTAAVISTDGNLHLDAGDSKSMYLNYYTQGAPINLYGSVSSGYSATFGAITANGEIRANSNISLRSGNNVRDSIYRVGGIYFTWDSDSYGTNSNHSIRSTNGDTWGDHITINSYGNIRMNIDSNSNGTNTFSIGRHTTGTANTLLTLDESGYLNVTGGFTLPNHTIFQDGIYRIVVRPNSYTSYGLGIGEYYGRPTVFSYTSNQPLYLVGGGRVDIGVTTNNRVMYINTAGIYLEQGWFRTYGQHGWYNQSYGGGVYMTDSTYVRTYNSKRYYSDVDTGGYTVSGHGGMVIGGTYDKSAFNTTYARKHSIQMEVDTYWGGYHDSHTGALIWCGNMNAGAWGTAEWGVRTSNNWASYYSGSAIRVKGTRLYASLGVETALNIHSDGGGRLGYYSSRKELKNLVSYVDKSEALSRICMLQPIDFTWKKEHRPHYDPDDELIDFNVHRGFFAEDAAAIDRTYGAWGWVYRDDESDGVGSLSMQPLTEELLRADRTLEDAVVVAYNDKAIMADLVGAVQELNRKIMELETQ